jgi:DMSO/TMAO reductase YedYZ heme-binding membrane subunit
MSAVLDQPHAPANPSTPPAAVTPRASGLRWFARPLWNRFTPLQLVVLILATIAPLVVAAAVVARVLGIISEHDMVSLALGAGENPGMVTFGAMFLASPVQWITGRSQVRVRKYLGIMFFLLALSNGAMFVIESGVAAAFGAPFLIAGAVAVVVAAPLFLTSSRWSQRTLGMRRWRLLHKLTYVVAVALVGHVLLIPDPGPGAAMIIAGFIARIPSVRRWLTARWGRHRPAAA